MSRVAMLRKFFDDRKIFMPVSELEALDAAITAHDQPWAEASNAEPLAIAPAIVADPDITPVNLIWPVVTGDVSEFSNVK